MLTSNKEMPLQSPSITKYRLHRNASDGNIIHYKTIQINGLKRENQMKIQRTNSAKKLTKGEYQKMMNQMFIRFDMFQEKKKNKRNKLRIQLEEKEKQELSFTPKLNKDNYLTKSANNIEHMNSNKIQKLIEYEKKHLKNINKHPQIKRARLEDINKNLSSLFEWENNKKQKLQKQQELIKDKEMQHCTFKPSLNKKSLEIANIQHKKLTHNNKHNTTTTHNILHKIKKALEQRAQFQHDNNNNNNNSNNKYFNNGNTNINPYKQYIKHKFNCI
jgi:hypothetical protein